MNLIATHINYYIVCRRKLWLFANGINMEHTSDTVLDGKLLHENSYNQRAQRHTEIEISASYESVSLYGKIDFLDARSKIIHETKRSDKVEQAHAWQLKFYIWLLELNGMEGVRGLFEYPKLRKTDEIILNESDRKYMKEMVQHIPELIQSEKCPPRINSRICKNCSYYELCYIEEV